MWANAQRDSRPAEYRWRPLFNAAKFGWCPLLLCRAVTLPRRETRWNYLGCPKLTKRSQPLVCRSSPYCKGVWKRYCCLTSFFPIVDTCLSCEDIARRSCGMVPRWRFLATFLRSVFAVSREQHISDLHSQFALGPRSVDEYLSTFVLKYVLRYFLGTWVFILKYQQIAVLEYLYLSNFLLYLSTWVLVLLFKYLVIT